MSARRCTPFRSGLASHSIPRSALHLHHRCESPAVPCPASAVADPEPEAFFECSVRGIARIQIKNPLSTMSRSGGRLQYNRDVKRLVSRRHSDQRRQTQKVVAVKSNGWAPTDRCHMKRWLACGNFLRRLISVAAPVASFSDRCSFGRRTRILTVCVTICCVQPDDRTIPGRNMGICRRRTQATTAIACENTNKNSCRRLMAVFT